jgi:hypothetical protein
MGAFPNLLAGLVSGYAKSVEEHARQDFEEKLAQRKGTVGLLAELAGSPGVAPEHRQVIAQKMLEAVESPVHKPFKFDLSQLPAITRQAPTPATANIAPSIPSVGIPATPQGIIKGPTPPPQPIAPAGQLHFMSPEEEAQRGEDIRANTTQQRTIEAQQRFPDKSPEDIAYYAQHGEFRAPNAAQVRPIAAPPGTAIVSPEGKELYRNTAPKEGVEKTLEPAEAAAFPKPQRTQFPPDAAGAKAYQKSLQQWGQDILKERQSQKEKLVIERGNAIAGARRVSVYDPSKNKIVFMRADDAEEQGLTGMSTTQASQLMGTVTAIRGFENAIGNLEKNIDVLSNPTSRAKIVAAAGKAGTDEGFFHQLIEGTARANLNAKETAFLANMLRAGELAGGLRSFAGNVRSTETLMNRFIKGSIPTGVDTPETARALLTGTKQELALIKDSFHRTYGDSMLKGMGVGEPAAGVQAPQAPPSGGSTSAPQSFWSQIPGAVPH